MKEKNKNILKGLGVGALACLGMFTFSGCSIDLNQEQINKLMYTVENSDKFMDEVVDLLTKQNNQMDKEKVFDLYKLAETKLNINYNNIWDNLKIKVTVEGDDDFEEVKIYTSTTGEKVAIMHDMDSSQIIYTNNDHIAICSKGGDEDYTKRIQEIDFNDYLAQTHFVTSAIAMVTEYEKTADDIVDFKVDEEGNSIITMLKSIKEEYEEEYYVSTYIIKVTLNSNNEIIGMKLTIACTDASDESEISSSITGNISFEYGALTYQDIENDLQIAKNVQVSE